MTFRVPTLVFRDQLPSARELGERVLLICDRKVSAGRKFPVRYAVRAGEGLKELGEFPKHMARIFKLSNDLAGKPVVASLGGGSVGDFSGFAASVLKRGVRLVHIPSTWLAAIDSAHGGKTALNIGRVKNQIGTFYQAEKIYLVKSVLMAQPKERAFEAFGELAKIALIDGRAWVRELTRSKKTGGELLWKFLPDAVESKYRVVRRDPLERTGLRHVLNLGHTVGHVLESAYGLSHGIAVGQGLCFSIEWSIERGLVSREEGEKLLAWLFDRFEITPLLRSPLPAKRFLELLLHDKKRVSKDRIRFVFVKAMGQTVIEAVSAREILAEAIRQGWAK